MFFIIIISCLLLFSILLKSNRNQIFHISFKASETFTLGIVLHLLGLPSLQCHLTIHIEVEVVHLERALAS